MVLFVFLCAQDRVLMMHRQEVKNLWLDQFKTVEIKWSPRGRFLTSPRKQLTFLALPFLLAKNH